MIFSVFLASAQKEGATFGVDFAARSSVYRATFEDASISTEIRDCASRALFNTRREALARVIFRLFFPELCATYTTISVE